MSAIGVVDLEVGYLPSVVGDGGCKMDFACDGFGWDCIVDVVCANEAEDVILCGGD